MKKKMRGLAVLLLFFSVMIVMPKKVSAQNYVPYGGRTYFYAENKIYSCASDGTGLKRLRTIQSNKKITNISVGSNKIVFSYESSEGEAVYTCLLNGSGLKRVDNGNSGFIYNNSIYYRKRSSIVQMTSSGRKVVFASGVFANVSYGLNKILGVNGKGVVYVTGLESAYGVRIITFSGKKNRFLSSVAAADIHPLSVTNNYYYYEVFGVGGRNGYDIIQVNLTTFAKKTIAKYTWGATASNTYLYYCKGDSSGKILGTYRLNLSTKASAKMTSDGLSYNMYAGAGRIFYEKAGAGYSYDLYCIAPNGTARRRLGSFRY